MSSSTITIEFPAGLAPILREEAILFLGSAGDAIDCDTSRWPDVDVRALNESVQKVAIYSDILDQLGWRDDGTARTSLVAPREIVSEMVRGAIAGAVMDINDTDALRDALRTVEGLERVRAQYDEAVAA